MKNYQVVTKYTAGDKVFILDPKTYKPQKVAITMVKIDLTKDGPKASYVVETGKDQFKVAYLVLEKAQAKAASRRILEIREEADKILNGETEVEVIAEDEEGDGDDAVDNVGAEVGSVPVQASIVGDNPSQDE